ncbi:UbiA prenyltransferase family protein [Candidatus Parcubacteria bacterium]|nr:UbiA prenyltransferase family protein [Candidatus Parcubacteria bacterium]
MDKTVFRQSKGYFQMLRIKDWIKSTFWIPLIGAVLVHTSLQSFFLIAIIYFCATAYSFVINNYFDIEIDKKHKEKIKANTNPLAQGIISRKGTLMLLGILLFIPLILAIRMSFIGFILVLLSIFASTLYSAKHIRLKEKPGLDIIISGLMFGFFPFLAGATLAGGGLNFPIILVGILFTILSSTGLLAHQAVDYEQDLGNTKTFAIKIGLKMSCICLILFIVASLLCFEFICQFFTIEWWLHYSILMFLAFCFPLRYIKEIKNIIKICFLRESPNLF